MHILLTKLGYLGSRAAQQTGDDRHHRADLKGPAGAWAWAWCHRPERMFYFKRGYVNLTHDTRYVHQRQHMVQTTSVFDLFVTIIRTVVAAGR